MDENKLSLSIIIVTYNDADYLRRCVSSIYEKFKNFDSWEIIIVNNDKNQDVASFDLDFSKIKLIESGGNIGFGRGNNAGAKIAAGKYLLFLNSDAEILDGPPEGVISEFEKDKNLGIVGAGIVAKNREPQAWSAGEEISLLDLLKNNLGIFGSRHIWEAKGKREAAWVSGATLFMRRSLFEELDGFDENIFLYFEDVDLCQRARIYGKKVIFFPEYKILHKCGGSHAENDRKSQKKNYYDSLVYYFRKHRPRAEFWAIKVIRRLFFV